MSENRVIKELGLEDFFDFLLNSSQDDRSNSSRSYGKKSYAYDQEIEKPRGIALDHKYGTESIVQERILDIPGIRAFGSPGTPSLFQKKPVGDSSSKKFRENVENGILPQISIRGASSGGKTPSISFENRHLDAEFMKFDPTIYHASQKTVKSDNNEQTLQEKLFPVRSNPESKASPVQSDHMVRDQWAFGNSNVEKNDSMEPKMEEEGFRKKRTNSFDEADFDAMDMILEEAKKSSNGDNSVQMIGVEAEEQQKPLDISPPEVNLNGVVEDRTPQKQFNKKQNDMTPMSNKPTSISKSSIERLKEVVFEADPSAQKISTDKENSSTSPSVKLFGSSNSVSPSRQRSQEFSITKSKIVQLDKLQIKSKLSPAVKVPEILDGFTQEDLDFLDQQLNNAPNENTQMEIEEPLLMTGSRKPSNTSESLKKLSQSNPEEEFKIRVNNGPVLVTGMGKPVTTNPKSFEKVKHLFEDDDKDNDDDFKSFLDTPTQKDEGDEPVLMTASNKPIPIHNDNLKAALKLFSQEEEEDPTATKEMFSFKTASMKPATFDANKLDSFKDLFESDSGENSQEGNVGFTTTVKERHQSVTAPTQKEGFSFKTASMKPATFNTRKLDSFKNLFEDANSQENLIGLSSTKQVAAANAPTQKEEFSFKTASMKPATFDSKKLDSFKDFFEGDSGENSQEGNIGFGTIKQQAAGVANVPTQKEEFSFKTASMKPATFDTKKLDSFKNLFEDDSAGNSQDAAKTTNEVFSFGTIKEPADGQNLFSFTTASMKPVKFDTKRLDSFKDMFEDNSGENSQERNIGFGTVKQAAAANAPTQKEEFSFKTASMKPATFDTKKLDSFKNLFEDENSQENVVGSSSIKQTAAANAPTQKEEFSFKTASMKPATFDKNKLDSFKNLFEDENSQGDMGNGFQPAFTTSSNKDDGDICFKMGNMKPAKFDTSKLQTLKNMFEDDFDEGEDMMQFGNAGASNDMPVLMTGNRKAIPLDTEKIKFAENLLKDEGSSDGGEKSKKVSFKTKSNNEEEEPTIQTASRKQVNVNTDKLRKFQDLFEQDDDEEESMNTKKSTSMFEETKSVSNGRHYDNSRDFMMNDRAKSNNLPLETKASTKNNFAGGNKKLGFGSTGAEAIARLFGGGSTNRNIPQTTTTSAIPDVSQKKLSPNPTKQAGPTISRGSPQSNKFSFNKDMTQQGVKKVLTEDLRVKNKGKEMTLAPGLTQMQTQRVGGGEGKKKNGFKFVKETGDGPKTVTSPTPGEKNKFKRNYIDFSKNHQKEPFNEDLFKGNAKVQRHARKIKSKKNYFFKDNYKTHPLESVIKEHIGINISNSLDYKFICSCALFLQSQSNACDSPSNEICCCNGTLTIGWSELRDALIKDGLNEDFLTEEWVKTHYRMIVWKLVSIERRLFLSSPSKKLTFTNVKAELEYRYFVEYCEGRRSALLRVIQSDPIPSNHFVLLVGEIIATPQKSYLVELSDGWYSVYFEVKPESSFTADKGSMTNNQLLYVLIKFKKLYSGMKIHLFGINLRKSKSDLPSDENEGTQKAMIDINYNCISKAKWNEKLGLARNRPLFLLKNLSCVKTQGGMIPELDVYVLKKYKLLESSTKAGLRQFHEESGEEGKRIFFKLRVLDSIIFFNSENNKPQKLKDLYCEIEITGTLCQMYDEIRENDRIRLRYFDGNFNPRHHKEFKYYDHETGKIYTKYLFLKSNRISQIETSSASSFLKQNLAPYKEFFKQNFKSSLLLTSLNLNPQYIAALNQKDLRRINNEVDVVGIILKPTAHKIDGCLSNGDFFQIMIHSNTFFSNQKSLEKNNAVIYFRNLQLLETEYVASENVHCHLLKTNDYSFLAPLQNSIQSETEILNGIVRDKGQLEMSREKLNRAIKKP